MYHRVATLKSDVWDIAVSPENFEMHLITFFKFKVSSPMIGIRILPTMGCLQPVPFDMKFIQSLRDQMESNKRRLANLKP